jgi:hydrogenase/urease accessory protein HupE
MLAPVNVSSRALLCVCLLLGTIAVHAHESRPAYLEITESAPGHYNVLWRTPVLTGMRLPVVLELPEEARTVTEPFEQELADSLVERRRIAFDAGGLIGKRIECAGLQTTITDVLVSVEFADGDSSTTLVKPSHPWIDIQGSRSGWQVAGDYATLGVEHILSGFDHLLFVLALLLIVSGPRRLLITITAFTIAHSITLAAATLGLLWVPAPPVEATIALSILFLASELLKVNRGEASLTATYPWVVAFTFGLLHGLGFAGALADVGLPQGEIPLALLMFNVGVELGQLLFVAVILALVFVLQQLRSQWPVWSRQLPAYGIGAMAAFWLVERVSGF